MTLSGTQSKVFQPYRDDETHLGSMFRTSACISMFLLCRTTPRHLLFFCGLLLFFSLRCMLVVGLEITAELLTENWRVFFAFLPGNVSSMCLEPNKSEKASTPHRTA
jgi:hypothetical protein